MSKVKVKTAYFCQECGLEVAKWAGQCPSCKSWNSIVEEIITPSSGSSTAAKEMMWHELQELSAQKAMKLEEIQAGDEYRYQSPDAEFNRCVGGGLVAGSITLVAGDPGIGKSTLFLQMALQWNQLKVLYISGEESAQQIKMRADRLAYKNPNLYLLTETDHGKIFKEVNKIKPQWIIIDSIQTMASPYIESAAGSVSQVKACTSEWQKFAKQTQIPVIIIGHITKEGSIAGPKVLEHMVDTVLQFEGDRHFTYRILRTLKNRFGSTSEIGIYEMGGNGLKEVTNPSEILISEYDEDFSGMAVACSLEGTRPLLVEVQALVTESAYGTPQRTTTGFDSKRLQLLLAVLSKKGGFQFNMRDVFLNITGGLKIEDPALDLSIVAALISSFEDRPLPEKMCFIGEVGLSGEVRSVQRLEQRVKEAVKLGMRFVFIPKTSKSIPKIEDKNVYLIPIQKVEELYQKLFNQ